MKMALEWNFATRRYSNIEIDDNCKIKADLMEEIKCPHCGKLNRCGFCYTSKQIHNGYGFGYLVCPQCYNNELQEWRQAELERIRR